VTKTAEVGLKVDECESLGGGTPRIDEDEVWRCMLTI